jgi:hypothetical protein
MPEIATRIICFEHGIVGKCGLKEQPICQNSKTSKCSFPLMTSISIPSN